MPASSAILIQPAADLTRDQLLRVAVARGCRHYAPLLPDGERVVDQPEFSHEALGAALLRGPADPATFQAIRCGAMVLSDLHNSAERTVQACRKLGVEQRLAHIARLGLLADNHPEFWRGLLRLLPGITAEEESFLPGLSRFRSETGLSGPGRVPTCTWLRTHYAA